VSAAAAFIAWSGAALLMLSEGRRGLALGMALITAGFAVLAQVSGGALAASAVLLGGGIVTVRRFRSGADVWGFMPPGSTARLVLAAAVGLVALWVSTSVMTGPGASIRFAALSVIGLMGACVLTVADAAVVLTAISALALAVAIASAVAGTGPGPAIFVVAAMVAAAVSWLRVREPNGA
jgi:hypothetical protein